MPPRPRPPPPRPPAHPDRRHPGPPPHPGPRRPRGPRLTDRSGARRRARARRDDEHRSLRLHADPAVHARRRRASPRRRPVGWPAPTTSATSSARRTARRLAGRFGPRPTMRLGLALSAVTTLAMAATDAPLGWAALRLVGGAASAWAMITVAAMVLAAAGADRRRAANVMFAGVGVGIVAVHAASSRRVPPAPTSPARMWLGARPGRRRRGGGGRPARRPASTRPGRRHRTRAARVPLPPDVRHLVASYTCAGFGYVITATYIVLIVRESDLGRAARGRDLVRRRCLLGVLDVAVGPRRHEHRRAPSPRHRPRPAGRRRPVGGVRARHDRRARRGDAPRCDVRRHHGRRRRPRRPPAPSRSRPARSP